VKITPAGGPNLHHTPSRLARKASRSGSIRQKRAASSQRSPILPRPTQPQWHLEANPHCNGGLHNAVLSVQDKMRRKLWVGALGTTTDAFSDALRKDMDVRMRAEADAIPVWIPDAEFSKCYDEFCHQVLWPALHYAVPDAPKTKSFYESGSWKQYRAVNERFADAIVANYQEGDISELKSTCQLPSNYSNAVEF
jgi:trehalose 6-phosphate synthase complex regulatory subunit